MKLNKLITFLALSLVTVVVNGQDCGEFHVFNFNDTIVNDAFTSNIPKNGFYFDMYYDTLIVPNTYYSSFYIVNSVGDTITDKSYKAWGRAFPASSGDIERYYMVFDNNMTNLPSSLNGQLLVENPNCQVPISIETMSIETNIKSKVFVYPNPVINRIFVDPKPKEIWVYNIQGKMVQVSKQGNNIDISSLQQGFYILKILLDDDVFIYRRIIKKDGL